LTAYLQNHAIANSSLSYINKHLTGISETARRDRFQCL